MDNWKSVNVYEVFLQSVSRLYKIVETVLFSRRSPIFMKTFDRKMFRQPDLCILKTSTVATVLLLRIYRIVVSITSGKTNASLIFLNQPCLVYFGGTSVSSGFMS